MGTGIVFLQASKPVWLGLTGSFLGEWVLVGFLGELIELGVMVAAGALIYLLAAILLRVEELALAWEMVKKGLARLRVWV
jgi:hypothetical protein